MKRKLFLFLLLLILFSPLISNSEEIVIKIGKRILIIGEVVGIVTWQGSTNVTFNGDNVTWQGE